MFGVAGKISQSLTDKNPGWVIDYVHWNEVSVDIDQGQTVSGLNFGDDGSKMYILSPNVKRIYQWNLSTPYDITTATISGLSSPVMSSTVSPYGIHMASDGLSVYIVDFTDDNVDQYTLSTAWNISTMSATASSVKYIGGEDISPHGLYLNSDESKMYVVGASGNTVMQYNLGTPGTVSSATHIHTFSVFTYEVNPEQVFWSSDGTKMFIYGDSSKSVVSYTASTPWLLSSCVYETRKYYSLGLEDPNGGGMVFHPDGTRLFFLGANTQFVYQYELPHKVPNYAAETSAHISRLTGVDLDDYNLYNALDNLIVGLKNDGIWDKVDHLAVAHYSGVNALLNLKGTSAGAPDATKVGASQYNARIGYRFDYSDSNYADLGVTESAATLYGQHNGHAFVYLNFLNDISWTVALGMGWRSTADESKVYIHPDYVQCGIQGVLAGGRINQAFPKGFIGQSINASNERIVRLNDSSQTVTTDFTYTLDNTNTMKVGTAALASTTKGTDAGFAAWGYGAGLTSAELGLYQDHIQAFAVRRGANY